MVNTLTIKELNEYGIELGDIVTHKLDPSGLMLISYNRDEKCVMITAIHGNMWTRKLEQDDFGYGGFTKIGNSKVAITSLFTVLKLT